MAGIIDIRYDIQSRIWTAKPRFAYDRESFENGAASGSGMQPLLAVYDLCDKLPDDMANKVRLAANGRMYRSPEYIFTNDKCVEVDGHCPNRKEWWERFFYYRNFGKPL